MTSPASTTRDTLFPSPVMWTVCGRRPNPI